MDQNQREQPRFAQNSRLPWFVGAGPNSATPLLLPLMPTCVTTAAWPQRPFGIEVSSAGGQSVRHASAETFAPATTHRSIVRQSGAKKIHRGAAGGV